MLVYYMFVSHVCRHWQRLSCSSSPIYFAAEHFISLASVEEENWEDKKAERIRRRWLLNSVFSPLNLRSCLLLRSLRSPAADLRSSSWPPPFTLAPSECLFRQFLCLYKDFHAFILLEWSMDLFCDLLF